MKNPNQILARGGRRNTRVMWAAIDAAEKRCLAWGGKPFVITQGGHNGGAVSASAGTHDGDAVDLSIRGLTKTQTGIAIEALRWAGIFASLRTNGSLWGVRPQGFSTPHIHGVPNGWGRPSRGAQDQARAYRNGRDGLRGNGPDAGGPGHTATFRNRLTPMTEYTAPGLPSTGAGGDSSKEAPLSAAEVKEIKDHIDAKIRALQGGGYDREVMEAFAEAAARQTNHYPVHRGGKKIPVIQEVADIKTAVLRHVSETAAWRKAQEQAATDAGIDVAAVKEAAKDAVREAIKEFDKVVIPAEIHLGNKGE